MRRQRFERWLNVHAREVYLLSVRDVGDGFERAAGDACAGVGRMYTRRGGCAAVAAWVE